MNENKWQDISEEIKKIFKTAVKLLYEKGKMKHSQAKRYLSSGKVHTNFCVFACLFCQPFHKHENIFVGISHITKGGGKKICSTCLRLKSIQKHPANSLCLLFFWFLKRTNAIESACWG